MTCKDLQEEVLANGLEDAAVKAHLHECADCRLAVEIQERLIAAKPDVEKYRIPKRIDYHITSEAKAFIDERRTHLPARVSVPKVRPFYRWASVFAYAACFLLVAGMLIIALTDSDSNANLKTPKVKTAKTAVVDQEIRKWDNLDMSDEIFSLNAEIEINFAAMSLSDDDDKKAETQEDEEFNLELPNLMI